MNFWKSAEQVSGLHGSFGWAAGLFLAITCFIYWRRPAERKRTGKTFILFALSLIGLFASAALIAAGLPIDHWVFAALRGISLFMLAAAIVNTSSVFVFTIALRAVRLEPPEIAQDLLIALVYLAAGIGVLYQSGVREIVATSAVLTAVIGFSLQDLLGNIMGGTFLQLERMIRVGDWVRVDDIEGRVKTTRWRHTSIETRNWDTIVIPNSMLSKAKVTLLGRRGGSPAQRRQWVYFHVALNQSPVKVIHCVETALRAEPIPCVAQEPQLHCLLADLKNGDGTFAVRYWLTDLSKGDPTDSLIRTRIYMALRRAGIPLAVPSQSILITDESSHRDRRQSTEMEQRNAILRDIELFRSLTDDEREELAALLVDAPFARGEAITQQGAQAHWLYILTEGEADVRVSFDGVSKKVGSLKGRDYFGEMGLMTGDPRTATVVAQTDAHCYRLSKESFQGILRRRPEIAEEISATLAQRRIGLDAAREQASEAALREQLSKTQRDFLLRMREFFGLAGTANTQRPRNSNN